MSGLLTGENMPYPHGFGLPFDVHPPVQRLGARCDTLVARANIALSLLRRNAPDDHDETMRLLNLALDDARAMRIPEAGQIEAFLQVIG